MKIFMALILQGLLVYGQQGKVVHSQLLSKDVCIKASTANHHLFWKHSGEVCQKFFLVCPHMHN